jgi:hypothetical protein
VTAKRLELLSELVPQARVIALLVNPNSSSAERVIHDVQQAARAKGVQLSILKASTDTEIDAAFASLIEGPAGALLVGADPFLSGRREQLVALASRHAVPSIYAWREFAEKAELRGLTHTRCPRGGGPSATRSRSLNFGIIGDKRFLVRCVESIEQGQALHCVRRARRLAELVTNLCMLSGHGGSHCHFFGLPTWLISEPRQAIDRNRRHSDDEHVTLDSYSLLSRNFCDWGGLLGHRHDVLPHVATWARSADQHWSKCIRGQCVESHTAEQVLPTPEAPRQLTGQMDCTIRNPPAKRGTKEEGDLSTRAIEGVYTVKKYVRLCL